MDPSEVMTFYDKLAPDYRLIYADWLTSVRRQAAALDCIIRSEKVAAVSAEGIAVWDCACGVGTQTLGLAELGYAVHATDLSPAAVTLARANAESLGPGNRVSFGVADMRNPSSVSDTFDVVLACDNALPHLLTDADLDAALGAIRARLRSEGIFIASIRDYDRLLTERPRAETPRVIDGPDGRRIVFQVWDWLDDGRTYTLSLFLIQPERDDWATKCFTTTYHALTRADLSDALRHAGFGNARWYAPDESGFFQPLVVARG